MSKTFVLDTNVLLHNATAIESFADNTVVLPMAVIEELDRFKKQNDELGRNARQVIRRLDALRAQGHLSAGVKLENGGTLRISLSREVLPDGGLDEGVTDNRILAVAYYLAKQDPRVIFVSKDINARLKADALGLQAEDFEKQKVNFDELFTGYREVRVPGQIVDQFHKGEVTRIPGLEAYPNEFVQLVDEGNEKHGAIGRVLPDGTISRYNNRFERAWGIKPGSREQRMALELLLDPNVLLVTLVGRAGTGKTLLALAAGMELTLRQKRYDKLLVSRPIMPLGRDIGYLPGDKAEKLSHWMGPIFDNLAYLLHLEGDGDGKAAVQRDPEALLKERLIELEALTYIRGRSIPRQYVIVDEAQNLTPHEIKTIVSRAGEGTKMVLTGDPYQIDNPYLDSSSNGLSYAVERLKALPLHGHVTLRKSERSVLAAAAADLL